MSTHPTAPAVFTGKHQGTQKLKKDTSRMSKSIARTVDLIDDPEIIAKYDDYHRNAWPEVREKQKAIGIERMEIFRSENHLFMYITLPDDFDLERVFRVSPVRLAIRNGTTSCRRTCRKFQRPTRVSCGPLCRWHSIPNGLNRRVKTGSSFGHRFRLYSRFP